MSMVPDRARPMSPEEADEFTTLLLDTLYALSPYKDKESLLPLSMGAKPASYEKYPQLLFSLLEANRQVETAFTNWRGQVLRKLDYLDIDPDAYIKLEHLHRWMTDERHRATFADRSTLRHLRKSMFGRTYVYLYPRLHLIMEFASYCLARGALDDKDENGVRLAAVSDPAFISAHFREATPSTQALIKDTLGENTVEYHIEAAQEFLLQHQAYFQTVFRNKAKKGGELNEH